MLRVCFVELAPPDGKGSLGARYVVDHMRRSGHVVDVMDDTADGYDIEMVSVHHVNDYDALKHLKKRSRIRLLGGHPMSNNPRPCIPFADYICIGEGESWCVNALGKIERGEEIDLPGTIDCRNWVNGSAIPERCTEKPLPNNAPVLNYDDTASKAWYIEIARGCPFSCHYCELGTSKYRDYTLEYVLEKIDQCDMTKTKKINVFAPDEASHKHYMEIQEAIKKKGFLSGFASMRIDTLMKRGVKMPANTLIRIGLDGMTEETRKKANKRISDRQVYEYFQLLTSEGHTNFKMFMIWSYPWETEDDFSKFEALMDSVMCLPVKKNIHLRIKWTPFIPQPSTVFGDVGFCYSYEILDRIQRWHKRVKSPSRHPGFFVANDGIMSERTHTRQCLLTLGDENSLVIKG